MLQHQLLQNLDADEVIADKKQLGKITEEFYAAVRKEIAIYQGLDYRIKSGSWSPSVMERWVLKIQALEEKEKSYEQVLRWEHEFSILNSCLRSCR